MNHPTAPPPPGRSLWRFAGVVYDERTHEIERDGLRFVLERTPNALLRHLLAHAGEIVTKDALLDAVWPGRIVTDGVLSKHVARLRRAIADDAQETIASISGVGYRLAAQVVREDAPVGPDATGFDAGMAIPGRPHWRLARCLGRNELVEVWQVRNRDTGELAVLKLTAQEAGVPSLKREVTVSRLLSDSFGGNGPHVPVRDWDLARAPWWIELPWLPEGSLLDAWQARSGLWSLDERIAVMARLADAIAMAHSVGVLHKDLKPANVLVRIDGDASPVPVLSDFGSAVLFGDGALHALGITRLGFTQPAGEDGVSGGTPLYLAPEVVRGHPFTLASDAFAFGVMLYQMVIDDLLQPIAPGWERDIEDPVLKDDIAALVEGDPARRRADLSLVARQLDTLRERREERRRRQDLAAEAEHARRAAERARGRRNIAFGFSGLLLVALLATGALYLRAESARTRAESESARADRQATRANAINDFLLRDLLASGNPFQADGPDVRVGEVFDRAAANAGARFDGDPETEASVRRVLAGVFLALSRLDDAEAQARQAIALLGDGAAPSAERRELRLDAQAMLADILVEQGRADDAHALLGDPARWTPGPASSDAELRAAKAAAFVAQRRSRNDAAIALYDALLPELRRRLGDEHRDVLATMRARGDALDGAGRLQDALEAHRQVHAIERRLHGDDDLRIANSLRSIAAVEYKMGRLADGLARMERAEALMAAQLAPQHLRLLELRADLATFRIDLKQYDEAERLMLSSLADARATLPPGHDHTLIVLSNLALLYGEMERYDDALAISREAVAAHAAKYGADAYETLFTRHNLASTLQRAGRWREAEAQQRDVVPAVERLLADDHWHLAVMRASWGNSLVNVGELGRGRALMQRALPVLRKELGDAHEITRKYIDLLAALPAPAG